MLDLSTRGGRTAIKITMDYALRMAAAHGSLNRLEDQDLGLLSDDDLLAHSRNAVDEHRAQQALEVLYERYYEQVTRWGLRFCGGDREAAADLAQDVFHRVHRNLDSFRSESRFSTWLYTIARRIAIDRTKTLRKRGHDADEAELERMPDPRDSDVVDELTMRRRRRWLREALRDHLDPVEGRVMYLHYIVGMSLRAITDVLDLRNASGAKAYVVSARRKIERVVAGLERRAGSGTTSGDPA